MPYTSTEDLPAPVRHSLPEHAQEIFMEAFNNAYHEYDADEVRCFKVAWGAVKKQYVKRNDRWISKDSKKHAH